MPLQAHALSILNCLDRQQILTPAQSYQLQLQLRRVPQATGAVPPFLPFSPPHSLTCGPTDPHAARVHLTRAGDRTDL
jgi:hypothetical protein